MLSFSKIKSMQKYRRTFGFRSGNKRGFLPAVKKLQKVFWQQFLVHLRDGFIKCPDSVHLPTTNSHICDRLWDQREARQQKTLHLSLFLCSISAVMSSGCFCFNHSDFLEVNDSIYKRLKQSLQIYICIYKEFKQHANIEW